MTEPVPIRPGAQDMTAEDIAELEARRAALRETRGRSAGIPPKWQGLGWADLDPEESPARARAIAAAQAWAGPPRLKGGPPPGLLLIGPVGIGKTRIAATAAQARLRYGPVRWVPVTSLMMKLSLGFGDKDRERALKWLEEGDGALALDDLDKVKPSEFQLGPIFSAINRWVDHELPLLVTCNKTLEELERDFGERYGPPIASRLTEHCSVFEIKGRDRRVQP